MQKRNKVLSIVNSNDNNRASLLDIGQYLIDGEKGEYIAYQPITPNVEKFVLDKLGYNFSELTKLENSSENILSFITAKNFETRAIWSNITYKWLKIANININKNLFENVFNINTESCLNLKNGETKMEKLFLKLFIDDLIKTEKIKVLALLSIEELEKLDISQSLIDAIMFLKPECRDKVIDRFEYVLLALIKHECYAFSIIKNNIFHNVDSNCIRIQKLITLKNIFNDVIINKLVIVETIINTLFIGGNCDEEFQKVLLKGIIFRYLICMNKESNIILLSNFITSSEIFKKVRNEAIIEYIEYKPRVYEVYFYDKSGNDINYLFTDSKECEDFMLSIPSKTNNKKLKKILMSNLL